MSFTDAARRVLESNRALRAQHHRTFKPTRIAPPPGSLPDQPDDRMLALHRRLVLERQVRRRTRLYWELAIGLVVVVAGILYTYLV